MPNPGDYILRNVIEHQAVRSNPRTFGVTFSPSSSNSRLNFIDSGARYEVMLNAKGEVLISSDGKTFQAIPPAIDACSGRPIASFQSFQNKRIGESLEPVAFDMLAVGRGRILAKERGTDRLFHLILDELFRTSSVQASDCSLPSTSSADEDPPVPSNYLKLDPEFFQASSATSVSPATYRSGLNPTVPPELVRNYAGHPASSRFPIFSEFLNLEGGDVTIVPVKPRVWYLIDCRSPLSVFGLDELQNFIDDDLRAVADAGRLENDFLTLYENHKSEIEQQINTEANKLNDPLTRITSGLLTGAAIGGMLALIPGIGLILGLIVSALVAGLTMIFLPQIVAAAINLVVNLLVPSLVKLIADQAAAAIQTEGFAALGLPLCFAIPALVGKLRSKAPLPWATTGVAALTSFPDASGEYVAAINIRQAVAALNNPPGDGIVINGLVRDLIRAMRVRTQSLIPNEPPAGIPTYTHVQYIRADANPNLFENIEERRAISFTKVMDLGVGYSHWHEHWQKQFGGEIQGLLATRPLFQQEHFNSIMYRFLNGPVLDGDGFNDGTCNFFMLVKLVDSLPSGPPPTVGPEDTGSGTFKPRQQFAILWIDEQSYFTQRWRLLHPTDDVAGDLFSLQRTLKDKPLDFNFDRGKFWCPFLAGAINDDSRMAVTRFIIAVTGVDHNTKRPEIYTICFAYGVCDHTWRWREYPQGATPLLLPQDMIGVKTPEWKDQELGVSNSAPLVFTNSLTLREDTTMVCVGRYTLEVSGPDAKMVRGRWFQKYLPANLRHAPEPYELTRAQKPARGFDHEWDFFSERAYQFADRYHLFGVYQDVIDSRCQYYEVDLLPDNSGNLPSVSFITSQVWSDSGVSPQLRLHHNTINTDWSLSQVKPGYISLRDGFVKSRIGLPTMSMYEPTTRFRLIDRGPRGLIAIFHDKRDDELQTASELPQEVKLVSEGPVPSIVSPHHGIPLSPTGASDISLLFKRNRRVLHTPIVQRATISRVRSGGATASLRISFWTPQSVDEVTENIWKIYMAALDTQGNVISILDSGGIECFSHFVRQGIPTRPLPLGGEASPHAEFQYDYVWTGFSSTVRDTIDMYCMAGARISHGTSIWFEDIVGHKSTPQYVEFLDA